MIDRRTKTVAAAVAGIAGTVVSFFFLVPAGCNDEGGVPSWERCTSFVGTPAFSVEDFGWANALDVTQPILTGLVLGLITWWLLGSFRGSDDSL